LRPPAPEPRIPEGLRRRLTARVLLLDPQGRILLMKGRLPGRATGGWFTVGGGAEPGETVLEAAAREIVEETGLTEFELGPVVWRRGGEMQLPEGGSAWLDEHYVVAHTPGGEPVRHGWQDHEVSLIDDIRWWTHQELLTTQDRVFPPDLPALLADVLAGRFPADPLWIRWR
jgi:8-oxo-dGTP pyrophosphatase MutT (NUDIX family)